MSLDSGRILVTGAGGFIGSHLTEELVRRGYNVRAFVFYSSQNSWGWLDHAPPGILEKLEVFPGDIRDPDGVLQAMRGCSTVLHLAALIGIPFSYHSPHTYVETNVRGTLNVLQAARQLRVTKLVHTSTSEVYGTARQVPITEDHPLQGQSPYSATKIAADQIALSFYHSFETPVAVIRPFNAYGPRQSARAVIPTIITQLSSGVAPIRLGATEPTRDFNYVSDIVNGFIAVAESERCVGEVVNIGSGFEISIGETARLIAELMGVQLDIETDDERVRPQKSEVQRLWADNSKARDLTTWRPAYAGIEGFRRGLEETIAWLARPENLERYKAAIYNI